MKIPIAVVVLATLAGCSSQASGPAAAPAPSPSASSAPQQLTVTQEDLRAPFYPGAIVDVGTAMKVKTETEESVSVEMKSTDGIEEVRAFYEEKVNGLKLNPFTKDAKDHFLGEVKTEDGGTLAVQLQLKEGFVKISAAYGKH